MKQIEIPKDALDLIAERDSAKARKDFVTSDKIRKSLEDLGYVVTDTKTGTKIQAK